jgi:hypothetical protein
MKRFDRASRVPITELRDFRESIAHTIRMVDAKMPSVSAEPVSSELTAWLQRLDGIEPESILIKRADLHEAKTSISRLKDAASAGDPTEFKNVSKVVTEALRSLRFSALPGDPGTLEGGTGGYGRDNLTLEDLPGDPGTEELPGDAASSDNGG